MTKKKAKITRRKPLFFPTKESAKTFFDQSIEFYDPTNPDKRYQYHKGCFYCGRTPLEGYMIEMLSDGRIIGKPVCRVHHP